MAQKTDKIASRLKKALGLFTILPATMIPIAVAAQESDGGNDAIRVGDRIAIRTPRMNIRVRPRMSVRVNSLRKIEGIVGIRVLTPNADIKN